MANPIIGDPTSSELIQLLEAIKDPEIDVINIVELGIVRGAEFKDGTVTVTITPTYSGCPAMQVIEDQVGEVLRSKGYKAEVRTTYNPPWSTDWMTDEAREKLRKYGISPPGGAREDSLVSISSQKNVIASEAKQSPLGADTVCCPLCNTGNVKLVSEFGSTACKALYTCLSCKQPFEHFKRI